VEELAEFVDATGDDVEVVFDRSPRPWANPAEGTVAVDFARSGGRNAADYVIERKVGDDPEPGERVVVTSDRRLAERVRSLGGRTMSSRSFINRMGGASERERDSRPRS
jgi:predicted RNA-binding protein with PIN domain